MPGGRRHASIDERMSLSRGIGTLYRGGYLLAVYTGLRAAFNYTRSAFLPQPRMGALDGKRLHLNDLVQVSVRVHARAPAHSLPPYRRAGMISIGLASPQVPRPLYALLCMTSHFACGHIEIAFYEEPNRVVFYGIRNIIKGNADRIGCKFLLRNLQLSEHKDEIVLLRKVIQAVHDHGMETSFAAPQDCVKLSVNRLLLHPKRRDKILATLQKKYARIWKQVGVV